MDENNNNNNVTDNMVSSVKEYVALKIDELKLKGVEGLSLLCSKLIFIFLAGLLLMIAFVLLGLALGFFMGEMLGSNAMGFTAVGVLFIIIFFILYLVRNKLFINSLVRFFVKLLFNDNSK